MLAGLQGSGKTTLAAKLGLWLKEQGHSPLLVAADLQRPNAVNQLQVVGQRAGVHVYAPEPGNASSLDTGQQSGDPVAVARSSITEAERRLYDVVIVDTAGRLGIDAEMMKQAVDIRDAVHPDEVLFVVDAMIGQDAMPSLMAWVSTVWRSPSWMATHAAVPPSIARVTGKPIMFASNGEALADFDVFHPDRMASRILGMGDMLTLIEQAEKTFDAEQSAKAPPSWLDKGESSDADFLQQMQMVRKMGPLSKVFGMLPGMGELKDRIAGIDERDVDHIEAIIHSMTGRARQPQDHRRLSAHPDRQRSRGGVSVNGLINRFFEARKMMTSLATGTMPGMPAIAGLPGPTGSRHVRRRVAGRLGQPGQAQRGSITGRARRSGGSIRRRRIRPGRARKAMSDFQLPPELRGRFGK